MPRIGLALGGGSARGFAHIGVLQVLEEEGIEFDLVAGTSIGSVFGACYLSGCDLYMLEKLAREFKQNFYLDIVVPRLGLIKGDKVEALIRLLTKNKTFDQLAKPFYAVAVDLRTGERLALNQGPVAEAVRASIAIPGVFTPKKIGSRWLVDGGVLDLIPVDVLLENGAEKIIAVDVRCGGEENYTFEINNVFDVLFHSDELSKRNAVQEIKNISDIFIQPDLAQFNPADFTNAWKTIALGRKAAEKEMPRIKALLKA